MYTFFKFSWHSIILHFYFQSLCLTYLLRFPLIKFRCCCDCIYTFWQFLHFQATATSDFTSNSASTKKCKRKKVKNFTSFCLLVSGLWVMTTPMASHYFLIYVFFAIFSRPSLNWRRKRPPCARKEHIWKRYICINTSLPILFFDVHVSPLSMIGSGTLRV